MISDREVKEAVEQATEYSKTGMVYHLWLKPLLTILEAYLSAEMPEEMYDPTKTCQPDYPDDYTKGKVYGFNEALRLCRLASTKDKMRLVYEVSNKTTSILFATQEDAEKFVGGYGATVGFEISCRPIRALANVKQGREG